VVLLLGGRVTVLNSAKKRVICVDPISENLSAKSLRLRRRKKVDLVIEVLVLVGTFAGVVRA
jgi:hypothetical protein